MIHATRDDRHADKYNKELAYEETTQIHKADVQKSIKTLFKFRTHERGADIDWEPEIRYTNGGAQTHQIRDFLTDTERRQIKQAVLKYGSIPHYNNLTPEERDEWRPTWPSASRNRRARSRRRIGVGESTSTGSTRVPW